jgi:small subunit ribosomal protein S1
LQRLTKKGNKESHFDKERTTMTDREPVDSTGHDTETNKDDEREDFAALFEATQSGQDRRGQRETKIDGTVVSIGEEWIFVDVGDKTEGIMARDELVLEDGSLDVQVGDVITAYVVRYRDGEILLSRKMTAAPTKQRETRTEAVFR